MVRTIGAIWPRCDACGLGRRQAAAAHAGPKRTSVAIVHSIPAGPASIGGADASATRLSRLSRTARGVCEPTGRERSIAPNTSTARPHRMAPP